MGLTGADILIVNDYEFELLKERVDMTAGSKGSRRSCAQQ